MPSTQDTQTELDRGFTLIELLIVIVILGVLATVVVFAVGGITDRGDDAATDSDAKTVEHAMEAYRAANGNYPNESTLVSAGFLRGASALHDISLALDGSNYTLVPAGSGGGSRGGGGGGGGGGGNGGSSDQSIGSFDATVYNQGGSPVVAVFTHRDISAGLASISPSFAGEIIWFNDPDLDTATEISTALGTITDDGVLADNSDAGWDAGWTNNGTASDALGVYGNAVIADGWKFSGNVEGLVNYGTDGVSSGAGTYLGHPVTTFGSGARQVALFPTTAAEQTDFANFAAAGRTVPGVTLNLMPILPQAQILALAGNADFSFVGWISNPFSNDMTTAHGDPYVFEDPSSGSSQWMQWQGGYAYYDIPSWATEQAEVLI